MDKYFTIGEISKLFNLPIKTLRYYDQRGLIKPAYINKENNYRYYSVEQFIVFDVIKYSKMMGMSLDEIKNLININLPLENTLDLIEKQTKLLKKRINELSDIKNSMEKVHNNIADALNYDNDVFIKYNEERKYVSYGFISKTVDELEVNLRKVVLDIQSKRKEVYSSFGTGTSFE
ncbi:MerR family transcriptional regulator, partial [Clostridium botulinum]|uniref:MerR family transcriptional regulator n=2 Tax=Clostridium botulinum TaxID=1491 RepID=UPI000AA26353